MRFFTGGWRHNASPPALRFEFIVPFSISGAALAAAEHRTRSGADSGADIGADSGLQAPRGGGLAAALRRHLCSFWDTRVCDIPFSELVGLT